MINKSNLYRLIIFALLVMFLFTFTACEKAVEDDSPIYSVNDNESNQLYKDNTDKPHAIEKVTNSIENLQNKLDTQETGEGGYYLGFDFHINTESGSNFRLKLQAHLFTWPYMNDKGVIREDDLAKHNEIIKKSTILIEWYDGITNSMLIGFYFDGVKANPNDPGNILYLNVQGDKRWFADFGDTVMFQQLIRLITSFSLDDVLSSAGVGEDGGVSAIETLLNMAITNNYKLVLNENEETEKEVTTVLFNSVSLDVIKNDLTVILQNIFSPYGNKIDPLTNKYLGFKFSVLGRTSIQTINSDMLFYIEPDTDGIQDLLTSARLDFEGAALLDNTSIPFTADFSFFYGAAPPAPIQLDKEFYKFYDRGKYEFTGNLYLPTMNLNLDALIRTKVNEYDNSINNVFAEYRDIANGDLIIGNYYKNELIYLDVEGLQHLYGGVKIDDIGFPKVYIENFDLAVTLGKFFDFIDDSIVKLVDNLLKPKSDSDANNMTKIIMAKMVSTEKDPNDPKSKNTVSIRIDHELLKNVLKEGGYGTFTTRGLINIINAQLPITLDELATIMGITSAEVMIEKTWFRLTLDVDTNQITIQMYSDIGIPTNQYGELLEESKLTLQLDLIPVKIGEDMTIAEICFDDFNELLPVYTYSAEMSGQFLFSNAELVDLSELLSSFMDDISGKNTPYILPMETKLDFTLTYDQYIKEQYLQRVPGGPRDGRWTDSSRNSFILNVFIKGSSEEENVTLFNIYAKDVSFKSDCPEEELGYIWIDLVCIRDNEDITDIPKFMIREDYWLQAVNRYLNKTEAGDNVGTMLNPDVSLSITTIISALMEDSFVVFEPEQIEITTSNETMQNIFNVDSLIGNIGAQIGLVQRVFGLEEIEDEFATYEVAQFEDIEAIGPYTTILHDSIDVTFTFDQNGRIWDEIVPMKFDYDPESIEIDENGSSVYNPTIYGPIIENESIGLINRFMGVQRSYKIVMTGGLDDRLKIVSLKTENWYDIVHGTVITKTQQEIDELSQEERDNLLPHYCMEPLVPFIGKLELYIANGNAVNYKAEIGIDWDSVTAEGGMYFTDVIIAKGTMGETVFPVNIIITNRVIDTQGRIPKYVSVTIDPDSDEITEAPVVDEIELDPYDYLLAKAIFLNQKYKEEEIYEEKEKEAARARLSLEFISYYFGLMNVEIHFVDLDPEVNDYRDTPIYNQGGFDWSFDKYLPTQYYDETDIVLTGGATYLHTDFKGQIVALQVNVQSRTIKAIHFDGEEEDNIYTADMLDKNSYVIPQYPIIIFEEKDDGEKNITKRFYDDINDIHVPMTWSNPIVDNPEINGTDRPFKGSSSNQTSSYMDFYRTLNVGEWIFKDYSPIVVITVNCPSKEIADLVLEEQILGYDSIDNWDNNIVTEIVPSYITVDDDPSGFYYVDPFNPATAKLPSNVIVTFKGRLENDPTYTKSYNVEWDTSSGLIEYVLSSNGNYYRLTVNSDDEKYIKLTTSIGNDEVGYADIVLCVKILTSNYTEITFFDSQNNVKDIQGNPEDGYIFNVNTYEGFELPHSFKALFGESDERYYDCNWKGLDDEDNYTINIDDVEFNAGNVVHLATSLPGGNGSVLLVELTINIADTNLENIIFTNIPMIKNSDGNLEKLPITLRLNNLDDFTIEGIVLNNEGKIENLYFGRGFYSESEYNETGISINEIDINNDQPISMYPYEFLNMLFKNAYLKFDKTENNFIKQLEIYNLKGIMDINDLLQEIGDLNFGYGDGKYNVRLGYGANSHNLNIRIKFHYGMYAYYDQSQENEKIDLYEEDGTPKWDINGYNLGDNLSCSVTTLIQNPAINEERIFNFGAEYDYADGRLDEWYVEKSNVSAIKKGEYITYIPIEILYNRNLLLDLEISSLTPQGFRIKKDININRVSFTNLYDSVYKSDDIFEIIDGKITIEDLYKFYPLNIYLNDNENLPTTINRTTANYNITLQDINWTISDNWLYFVRNCDYRGDSADILLATANILGWYEIIYNEYGVAIKVYHDQEKINLVINIETAKVYSLPLKKDKGLDTGFQDKVINSLSSDIERERVLELFNVSTADDDFEYREFIIYMDAYKNNNYQGKFLPPADLSIKYASNVVHTFGAISYSYRGYSITEIDYGINGILYGIDNVGNYMMINYEKVYFMKGDDQYNITLKVDLGAEQVLAIKIHFFDKTVVAVHPIMEYDDEEIRNLITEDLSEELDNIKEDIINKINISKVEYEIQRCLELNKMQKEAIDLRYIYNEIRKLQVSDFESEFGEDTIELLLDKRASLYPNPGNDQEKLLHNYLANILINLYNERTENAVFEIKNLILSYLNKEEGYSFSTIEEYIASFFDALYDDATTKIINNKIVEYVKEKSNFQLDLLEDKQAYVLKMKNIMEANLEADNIIDAIDLIEINDNQGIENLIQSIVFNELDRIINVAANASDDTQEFKDALKNKIYEYRDSNIVALSNLKQTLRCFHTSGDNTNSYSVIKDYFDIIFDFDMEDYLELIQFAIVQEIETTIADLISEMRASYNAELSVNTGGRLSRSINLSVSSIVNNIILEGKIIDAILKARNININHSDDGKFNIDPYADYIYVPARTEIIFSEENGGDNYVININWDKPINWASNGVNYKGNEGNILEAKNSAWEILYEYITEKAAIAEGEELSIEDDLLRRIMDPIINDIYFDMFGTTNLTDAMKAGVNGWESIDDEVLKNQIMAIIENKYSGENETTKNARAYDMWSSIKAWDILKAYYVEDNTDTPENETEIWSEVKLKLERKELGLYRNEFTASLYSEGIGSQDIDLIILIEYRKVDDNTWYLYNSELNCKKNDPLYHIDDPFAARVEDFPDLIKLDNAIYIDGKLIQFNDLSIDWEYTDEAISYSGSLVMNEDTGKMGTIIKGYIKNKNVGQMVSLRLVIDSWEYNDTSGSGLRQYIGDEDGDIEDEDNYEIMNPINFVFSKLVDYSAQKQYQVMFKKKVYKNEKDVYGEITNEWTEIEYENVLFYPEDSSLIKDSINDDEMIVIKQRKNYILYWDEEAKLLAYKNDISVLGNFSLGNDNKNKMIKNDVAYYEYEESYISKVLATDYTLESLKKWYMAEDETLTSQEALNLAEERLFELYGTTGVSLLVMSPLDTNLPDQVRAIGTLNQISDTDLGNLRILWNKDLNKAKTNLISYVKYMYPELTNTEAEKSAMELLMGTNRTENQEIELTNDIISWYKFNWEGDNRTEFSEYDYESWDLLYNAYTTSLKDRLNMQNLMDKIIRENGNRRTNEEMNEGWYKIYYFVRALSEMMVYTEEEKLLKWNNLYNISGPTKKGKLDEILQRITDENISLDVDECKALAYDVYLMNDKWSNLISEYDPYLGITNECQDIISKFNKEYTDYNDYEINALCWQYFVDLYGDEDLNKLDNLREKVMNEYPGLNNNEDEDKIQINALAYDRWITSLAFNKWFEKIANEMLMINEKYDIQNNVGFMDGGIDGSKKVTLLLQLTENGYIYTQSFIIRIVFLDFTPLAYYEDESANSQIYSLTENNLPAEVYIAIKTDYDNVNDYLGEINPYDNRQEIVFDMLDYYASVAFEDDTNEKQINGVMTKVKLIKITDIVWDENGISNGIIKSSSFTIGNITYNSNLLELSIEQ